MTPSYRKPADARAALEAALASAHPLEPIMEAVDIDRQPGRMFNMAHAFMLETYSATMSILFDRFDRSELDEMTEALATVGAERTLADWRVVRASFDRRVEGGSDPYDASLELGEDPALRPLLSGFAEQADEIRERLLAYEAHWDELVET